MASKIDICNLALTELGEGLIQSTDNPSNDTEQLCSLHYDVTRKALLNTGHFDFAVEKVVYDTPLLDPPAWGWQYAYLIPNTVLKVYDVRRSDTYIRGRDTRDTSIDYSIVGNTIQVSETPIFVSQIINLEDTTKFSDLFVQAFKYRLAASMCMAVTENRSLRNDIWQLYEETMNDSVDYNRLALEKGRQKTSSMISARYASRTVIRGTE